MAAIPSVPAVAANARYAIYFVPAADTALYRFGAAALGYDSFTGADLPTFDALPVDAAKWRDLTREPRRYGFHATLKAPFRLAAGRTEAELIGELEKFAASIDVAPAIEPSVRLLQRFIAIVPVAPAPGVGRLAASCVTQFDAFRAPLDDADRNRRLVVHLTAQQAEYVERWGYPYVFDEFRFHLTLTGMLSGNIQGPVLSHLRDRFERCHGDGPISINRLALLRQDNSGARFVVLAHCAIA
jgi:putative phosphonate metabolism protein